MQPTVSRTLASSRNRPSWEGTHTVWVPRSSNSDQRMHLHLAKPNITGHSVFTIAHKHVYNYLFVFSLPRRSHQTEFIILDMHAVIVTIVIFDTFSYMLISIVECILLSCNAGEVSSSRRADECSSVAEA